jgi:hypothetical protein
MSDPFGPVDHGTATAAPLSDTPFVPNGLVTSPRAPVVALVVELVAGAMCLMPSTSIFHIAGYLIGAFVAAGTAVAFRTVDRARRRSPDFVSTPGLSRLVTSGLVLGIALAALHAFYLAHERSLVR